MREFDCFRCAVITEAAGALGAEDGRTETIELRRATCTRLHHSTQRPQVVAAFASSSCRLLCKGRSSTNLDGRAIEFGSRGRRRKRRAFSRVWLTACQLASQTLMYACLCSPTPLCSSISACRWSSWSSGSNIAMPLLTVTVGRGGREAAQQRRLQNNRVYI